MCFFLICLLGCLLPFSLDYELFEGRKPVCQFTKWLLNEWIVELQKCHLGWAPAPQICIGHINAWTFAASLICAKAIWWALSQTLAHVAFLNSPVGQDSPYPFYISEIEAYRDWDMETSRWWIWNRSPVRATGHSSQPLKQSLTQSQNSEMFEEEVA